MTTACTAEESPLAAIIFYIIITIKKLVTHLTNTHAAIIIHTSLITTTTIIQHGFNTVYTHIVTHVIYYAKWYSNVHKVK